MKSSYHFSFGNSTEGPVGCCAVIEAETPEEAVTILKAAVQAQDVARLRPEDPRVEYLNLYLNADAITTADIDGSCIIDLCTKCNKPLGAGGDGYYMLCGPCLDESGVYEEIVQTQCTICGRGDGPLTEGSCESCKTRVNGKIQRFREQVGLVPPVPAPVAKPTLHDTRQAYFDKCEEYEKAPSLALAEEGLNLALQVQTLYAEANDMGNARQFEFNSYCWGDRVDEHRGHKPARTTPKPRIRRR